MSNDGLLGIALCCLSCSTCVETVTDHNIHNLPQNNDKNVKNDSRSSEIEVVYKKMDACPSRIIINYTFENKKCIKNDNGDVICSFCEKIVPDNYVSLIECLECHRYIGHPVCFVKTGRKCIFCK